MAGNCNCCETKKFFSRHKRAASVNIRNINWVFVFDTNSGGGIAIRMAIRRESASPAYKKNGLGAVCIGYVQSGGRM